MKEAIGTSMVFNLIMVFTGLFIAILVGSIAYSKSFKIRNRIINIVEKYYGYTDEARIEIEDDLSKIGYRIVDKQCPNQPRDTVEDATLMQPQSDYHFCVYQYDANRGHYYGVLVYMHFDVPFLRDGINIPIYGETRTFYNESIVY